MKGGRRRPPNYFRVTRHATTPFASMKGGRRRPPNQRPPVRDEPQHGASMKGGRRRPPNSSLVLSAVIATIRFNEGRPAPAAEYEAPPQTVGG